MALPALTVNPYSVSTTSTSTSTQTTPTLPSGVPVQQILATNVTAIRTAAPNLPEPYKSSLQHISDIFYNPLVGTRMCETAGKIVMITVQSDNNQQPLGPITLRGNFGTIATKDAAGAFALGALNWANPG